MTHLIIKRTLNTNTLQSMKYQSTFTNKHITPFVKTHRQQRVAMVAGLYLHINILNYQVDDNSNP